MLSRSFLVLAVVLIVTIGTKGQTNPFFTCSAPPTIHSYNISMNRNSEIIINNCTSIVTNQILFRLHQSKLRGRPVRLNLAPDILINELHLENVTHLDLSHNNLSEVDLGLYFHMHTLNLTFNRINDLKMIKLRSNHSLEVLDVSGNRLIQVKSESIPSINHLYLRSNNIFDLDRNLSLPESLLELDLTRNEIENLTVVHISSNTLKVLNLSINLINSLSNLTFAQLSSLQVLILECNKILEIPSGTFVHNTKLIKLNLRDNNLPILKKSIFEHMSDLQVLDVSKNHLLSLATSTMQNLNNLVYFSLSENTKICSSECKKALQFLLVLGGRLKVLKMSRLGLKQFPVTLTMSIRHLDLSMNQLISVQMGDLENFPLLKVLTLSSNEIQVTDKDVFFRLEYLEELYLDGNHLVRVPSTLTPTLRILHLNTNRISHILKTDLLHLTNLKELRLNLNLILNIESGSFISLNTLKVLDISNNPILTLNTDALEGANKLEILHASYLTRVNMNSTDLRYFPISELPNLKFMNLSHSPELVRCFLTDFPLLITVNQLENLDFDFTALHHVPSHLQHFLPRLKSISLLGNPINCSDELSDWKEFSSFDLPQFTPNVTEMKVKIVRDFIITIPSSRIFISSSCSFNIINSSAYSRTSILEFWKSIEISKSVSTKIPPSISSSIKKLRIRRKETQFKSAKFFNGSLKKEIEKVLSSELSNEAIQNKIEQIISSFVIPTSSRKIPTNKREIKQKAMEGKFEALIWNRSDEKTSSFFDLFPASNESTSDFTGRLAVLDDNSLEYTHSRLTICLIILLFLLIICLSLLTPSCMQNYWWRRHKYRSSVFSNECRGSIEISSISAFVEAEMSTE